MLGQNNNPAYEQLMHRNNQVNTQMKRVEKNLKEIKRYCNQQSDYLIRLKKEAAILVTAMHKIEKS